PSPAMRRAPSNSIGPADRDGWAAPADTRAARRIRQASGLTVRRMRPPPGRTFYRTLSRPGQADYDQASAGEDSMRSLALTSRVAALAFHQQPAAPKAASCDPLGNVQFICGLAGPEDLVSVPGTEWVVASGMAAGGTISLINVRDHTTTVLFPIASPKERLDVKAYPSCPGPID